MRKVLSIVFSLTLVFGNAQEKVWVFFKDKPNVDNQILQPEKYLSSQSLERRASQNIDLHPTDFPVESSYLNEIRNLNIPVVRSSKWLNASSVYVSSQIEIDLLEALPFVEKVSPVKALKMTEVESFYKTNKSAAASLNYGDSKTQIQQLNGDFLHDQGYRGQGMMIAVIDGGFSDVDLIGGFDSLWMNGRIVTSYDFVDNDTNVFHLGSHGRSVLSVMGGYIDGVYVGTAPNANYVLLKSEDESSEKKVEEDNWVAAAEFADSVGADVINSSLGYNTFDGGIGDYVYSDFDGRTTVVSQGAVWAHRKGILVVNSMGNEGSSSWQYMLSPADADSILSIGGADGANNHVGFASVGPTFDGRLKPNVSALATGVYVLSGSNTTQPGNGTSFAAPLISGLAACLWQADPTLTNYQVLELIERSSHQHTNPDTLLGYGIPNFALAFNNISIDERSALLNLKIYPVPFGDELTVEGFGENQSEIEVSLTNLNGTSIETKSHFENDKLVIDNLGSLSSGVYILTIISNNKSSSFKVLK